LKQANALSPGNVQVLLALAKVEIALREFEPAKHTCCKPGNLNPIIRKLASSRSDATRRKSKIGGRWKRSGVFRRNFHRMRRSTANSAACFSKPERSMRRSASLTQRISWTRRWRTKTSRRPCDRIPPHQGFTRLPSIDSRSGTTLPFARDVILSRLISQAPSNPLYVADLVSVMCSPAM